MEKEMLVTVPYGDFLDGVKAIAALEDIRTMIKDGDEYASKTIKAVLGLEGEDAGADRKQDGD